ncbi:MAG: hypothetical protein A2064_13695 [Spirochaetes bacterium GWB1_66_5]|nr:MAG: hypothetical protein A2064_13695 [Spirochaetes bacterium GWB1_66_5]
MKETGTQVPHGLLLEELQRDFPLVSRPFRRIGRRCGLAEERTLETTRELLSQGMIREISALLDARRIGVRTALVAVRAGDRAEELGQRISRHPGVSHNYLREHDWNLWFTLAVPAERNLGAEVRATFEGEEVPTMVLPALRTFKLQVRLRFTDPGIGIPEQEAPAGGRDDGPVMTVRLEPFEKRLLALLEEPLPLVPRPWALLASGLQVSQRRLLAAVGRLKRRGVVRRIAAVLRHRSAGFQANAMVCFQVPEERILEAGRRAAQLPQVSHCYQRETAPQWPYSLYAMLHARTRQECDGLVRELAGRVGGEDYQVLYSLRELKKRRIKHFGEKQ